MTVMFELCACPTNPFSPQLVRNLRFVTRPTCRTYLQMLNLLPRIMGPLVYIALSLPRTDKGPIYTPALALSFLGKYVALCHPFKSGNETDSFKLCRSYAKGYAVLLEAISDQLGMRMDLSDMCQHIPGWN